MCDPLAKADFGKACDVALESRMYLESIYENPDLENFVSAGVPEGVAWYFCRGKDIEEFSNRNKRPRLDLDAR